MKQCPACGRRFPDEFQFCQDDATPLTPVPGAAKKPERPKSRRMAALAVLAVAVVSLIAGSRMRHAPSPPANAAEAPSAVSLASASSGLGATGAWQSYRSPELGFACEYPAGWRLNVAPSRASPGAIRVVFQSPDPDVVILVDAERGTTGQTPLQKWLDLDARFRNAFKARYTGLGVQPTRLAGCEAATWRAMLQHPGRPLLEREDIGTTIGGRDYALLLTAPADRFGRWQSTFDRVAQSFMAQGN